MNTLFRYIVRNNALLLLPGLGLGVGIYIITDLFEKLDNFIDADIGVNIVASYFVYKLPLIVSQLLPVIFLLSTVVQLCLMIRARETIALYAGGVSPLSVLLALFFCGFFWACVQLGFSQWLGVIGEQNSRRIWEVHVHKRNLEHAVYRDIWFSEGDWVVSLDELKVSGEGTGFTAYLIPSDENSRQNIEEIVYAENFMATPGQWQLLNVRRYFPNRYENEAVPEFILPLSGDADQLRLVQGNAKPQHLSIWDLGGAIDSLKSAGSNVESLRTAWHAKAAYAASIVIMSMLAMALVRINENIYAACGLALLVTFSYYMIYTIGLSMGQKGLMPAFWAAWLANFMAAGVTLAVLGPDMLSHKIQTLLK